MVPEKRHLNGERGNEEFQGLKLLQSFRSHRSELDKLQYIRATLAWVHKGSSSIERYSTN